MSVDSPTSACQQQTFPDPIPGIIPFGTLTIFAGAPGVGKTAMLAEWCVRWRDGKTICDRPTNKPTGFFYLAADRQWKSHQVWFDAAGFGDIPHYSLADDHEFPLRLLKSPDTAFDAFLYGLEKLALIPGSHLIIDPVSPLYISGDPNRARDVATTLLKFSRICQQYQINITCAAHFGKQKNDTKEQYTRPQDRIAGSGAFAGFSDTQIYLVDANPPKTPYHTLGWNPRHEKAAEFHFERAENGLFVPYGLYDEISRREQALSVVPELPTEVKIIVEKIRHALDVKHSQAQEYLYSLVSEGRVVKVRRGIYQRAKPA